mmetsp:Transcript_23879/g.52910  ORF Transcript_23879/g.52910 Transcript_23879/m.52910 type:complete len:84 (-) Transcript_23879:32-283(-)
MSGSPITTWPDSSSIFSGGRHIAMKLPRRDLLRSGKLLGPGLRKEEERRSWIGLRLSGYVSVTKANYEIWRAIEFMSMDPPVV